MDKNKLLEFEEKVAETFNNGEIRYPVHLDNGNEDALIRIFKDFRHGDAVFGSWRMHYKALLAGVPERDLMDAIKRGESMALRLPNHRVWGSAIVGGIVPIAVGYAMGLQMQNKVGHVWCFIGDMTRFTGLAEECIRYANNFELPISFIIEDNDVSVLTDTVKTCGQTLMEMGRYPNESYFKYKSKYPHAGAGKRVEF